MRPTNSTTARQMPSPTTGNRSEKKAAPTITTSRKPPNLAPLHPYDMQRTASHNKECDGSFSSDGSFRSDESSGVIDSRRLSNQRNRDIKPVEIIETINNAEAAIDIISTSFLAEIARDSKRFELQLGQSHSDSDAEDDFDSSRRELSDDAESDPEYDEDDAGVDACLPPGTGKELEQDLNEFKKKLEKISPNIRGLNELETLIDASTKITRDITRQQEAKNAPSLPLSDVLTNLQNTVCTIAQLRNVSIPSIPQHLSSDQSSEGVEEQSFASISGGNAIDPARDSEVEACQEIIDVLQQGQSAFLKFSLPTEENKHQVQQIIDDTARILKKIDKKKITLSGALTTAVPVELKSQLMLLRELQKELERYTSPESLDKKLEEKQLYVDATIKVFDSLIENHQLTTQPSSPALKKAFEADAQAIRKILVTRSANIRNAVLTGNQPVAPATTHGNGTRNSKLVKDILKRHGQSLASLSPNAEPHEKEWLTQLIDSFLRTYPEADQRSGRRLLTNAKSWVLNNQRNWDVIESAVLVPVKVDLRPESSPQTPSKRGKQEKISGTTLARIKTITTPIGHLLNQRGLSIDSAHSPITSASVKDYRAKDPSNPHRTITTGRNSHATIENAHGVNVARTEAMVGNKQLFVGTRHATLSPYDLYPDTLKKTDATTLQKMAEDLLPTNSDITRISLRDKPISARTRVPANPRKGDVPEKDAPHTELDELWKSATQGLDTNAFITRIKTDEKFCALARRKAALNRAREVFLSEALGNSMMLERIQNGEPVHFNSISLITPDPFRHFLAKLMPNKYRRNDELTMRRAEVQAWQDLQAEITAGRLEINQKVVNAKIRSFSVGVNKMSLGDGSTLSRSLTSGWKQVEPENLAALIELIGNPEQAGGGLFGGQLKDALVQHESVRTQARMRGDWETVAKEAEQIAELERLAVQLANMWNRGDHRHAADQPYKFAARLALLSARLNSGTAFNCKSGKDRTAQLDMEVKLLAIQSESRRLGASDGETDDGMLPSAHLRPQYERRTDFDRYQLQHLIFGDKSRTEMQRYNTGVEGSKLNWRRVVESFAPDGSDQEEIKAHFVGRSFAVKS